MMNLVKQHGRFSALNLAISLNEEGRTARWVSELAVALV